jgi:hypothetical protein
MPSPLHCPYTTPQCQLQARYDVTASEEAVHSIVSNIEHEDQIADIITAASNKIYRGESCQRCGAWFPALSAGGVEG